MYAPSGAAAKVLTNPEKKLNHEVWKARMCGFANEKILMAVALCSASTCAARAWSQDVRTKEAVCIDVLQRVWLLSAHRQRELAAVDVLVAARVDRAAASRHDVVHRVHFGPQGRKFLSCSALGLECGRGQVRVVSG